MTQCCEVMKQQCKDDGSMAGYSDTSITMTYRVTSSALQIGAIVGPTLGNGLICWQPVIVGVLTMAQLWSNTDVSTVVVLLLSQCKPYNYAPTVGQHVLADYNRVVFLNILVNIFSGYAKLRKILELLVELL